MSLAIWKVWTKFYETKILIIYFIHILFNASWSVVFGFHEILLSLINLIIILAMVILLLLFFKSRDNLSFLLIVLAAWSSYALFLNASILLLN